MSTATAENPTQKPITAIDQLVVFVIGDRCYGKAKTYKEALSNAKKEGGAAAVKKHIVYIAHPSAYIDCIGNWKWKVNEEEDKIDFSPVEIHRVG